MNVLNTALPASAPRLSRHAARPEPPAGEDHIPEAMQDLSLRIFRRLQPGARTLTHPGEVHRWLNRHAAIGCAIHGPFPYLMDGASIALRWSVVPAAFTGDPEGIAFEEDGEKRFERWLATRPMARLLFANPPGLVAALGPARAFGRELWRRTLLLATPRGTEAAKAFAEGLRGAKLRS